MKEYRANADYTVVDRSPLQLGAGDSVKLGPLDKAWPGWIWASDAEGRGTYVPQEAVVPSEDGMGRMTSDFNARDLSVKKHEVVRALREVGGWLWCQAGDGREGWLPAFVLNLNTDV